MLRTALLAALIGMAVTPAGAAECGPRAEVLAQLAKKYKEQPTAIGLSNSGRVLEILVREDGQSWTVITTTPQGVSCLVDAGGDWVTMKLASLDPEA